MGTTYLFSIILIVAALQFILIGYLVVAKLINNRRELKENETYDQLLPIYIDFLMSEDMEMSQMAERNDDLDVVERILIDYTRNISRNEDIERVQELANLLLNKKYEYALKSRKWSARMNTLNYIEIFKMKSFGNVLLEKLINQKLDDEERKQIMKTLASLNHLEFLHEIVKYKDIPERVIGEILMRYGEKYMSEIIALASQSNHQPFIRTVIQIIGNKNAYSEFSFVEQYLLSEDAETRLRVLRAFEQMSYLVDPDKINPFLSSPIWEERMLAVKICGKLGLKRFQAALSQLIGDDVWWVRYYSGEAISRLNDGEITLQYIAEEHSDRYARDMAKQWISTTNGRI